MLKTLTPEVNVKETYTYTKDSRGALHLWSLKNVLLASVAQLLAASLV